MSDTRFGRLIPAMVTPFDSDLNLDLNRAGQLANRLADNGCDSIVVNGTTGESPTVFYPQKIKLFKEVVSSINGKVSVIANVGDNCTADTIDFAKDVSRLGVDALMLVVPYYNKPPQEGLYQHFKAIANSVDLPIILYNIPGRCVINMQAETTLRLARDCENIVGVKEASGDLEQIKFIIDNAPDGFEVFSGDDALTMDVMKLGGSGVISTIANVCPQRMKEIINYCVEQNFDKAKAAHERLLPLMNGLFATANPILVKQALKLSGFDVGGVRLPLVDATDDETAVLMSIMKEVGVL